MKKCAECISFVKEKDRLVCIEDPINMETECLLRHLLWRHTPRERDLKFKEKTEKFMDETIKQIDDYNKGEDWKNG